MDKHVVHLNTYFPTEISYCV